MEAIITPIITKLYEQESLTQEESQQLFDIIIRGELDPILMASALTALKSKVKRQMKLRARRKHCWQTQTHSLAQITISQIS